jgi:hypothetical protein
VSSPVNSQIHSDDAAQGVEVGAPVGADGTGAAPRTVCVGEVPEVPVAAGCRPDVTGLDLGHDQPAFGGEVAGRLRGGVLPARRDQQAVARCVRVW